MPQSKDGEGRVGAGTAPTIEHDTRSANPTPGRVVVHTGNTPVEPGMIGADTAIASQSQQMAAVTPNDTTEEEAPGGGEGDGLVGETLLGRYEITTKIGQGGMGAVYEATHTLIGKRVAVKVLLDKYAEREQIVRRLEQEARLASSIGHEHIIDITDFGTTGDGRTFVVMEFLEGESLGAALARTGPMDEQRVIRIAHQVASALGAAHRKGVIHRDVKPDNVFLLQRNDKDFVKVVDFGISKSVRLEEDGNSPRLTQTGMVLGTPLYMSPEQARGDDELDHRIDIYALGVIMYELITGEVPFRGNNYLSIISQVINDDPEPPSALRPEISADLEAVIMRALAKELDDRYVDMDELAGDLEALRENDGRTTARPRITASRWRKKKQRRSGLSILAWVAGLAVIVAAVVVTVSFTMSGKDKKKNETGAAVAIDAGPPAIKKKDPTPPPPTKEIARIKIETTPPGATIYADGGSRVVGKAPVTFKEVKVDKVVALIAELDGYNDAEFSVNPFLKDGDTVTIRLKKPKKGTAVKKVRRRPTKTLKKPPKGPKGPKKPPTKPTKLRDLKPSPYDN